MTTKKTSTTSKERWYVGEEDEVTAFIEGAEVTGNMLAYETDEEIVVVGFVVSHSDRNYAQEIVNAMNDRSCK